MMPPFGAVALLTTVTVLASHQDRYARPDPFDSSVSTLREAVRVPPTGGRNPALLALIELDDPEIRPLFQSLVQKQDRPVMQADAILGIARADSNGSIDAFTLRQVSDLQLRSEVLKSLIGRGLLKPDAINQILRWQNDEVLPEDRLFLVATLQRDGAPWQPSDIESIAQTKSSELRALYSLLLLEKGQSDSWEEFRTVIGEMSPEDRSSLLGILAPAIRSYKLKSAVDPLLRLAADRDVDGNVRAAVIGSALELQPAAGLAAMTQEVTADRSQRNLLRYALLLLVVADREGIDPVAFDLFNDAGASEIAQLAAAGRCANGGAGCADAFKSVIDLGIRPAAEWSMARAAALAETDAPLARDVMNRVLDLAAQARSPREPILILAVNAARELITLDPDGLRRRLSDPSTPPSIQEAIVLAMVDAAGGSAGTELRSLATESQTVVIANRRKAAAELAASIRGKLPRRFDSMALVAMARGGVALSAADVEHLGVIAAGGGRVDDSIQVQAAWLHLKAIGRHRDALARLAPE